MSVMLKKREDSDSKRLAALEDKMKLKKEEQNLIKQAFSGSLPNKRKVFNQEPKLCETMAKTRLFDEEENGDDDDEHDAEDEAIEIKKAISKTSNKRLRSDKEAKLIELQSRFAHDSRFQINERFLDDEDDKNIEVRGASNLYTGQESYNEHVSELPVEVEREKALDVLEEVLGKPVRRKDNKKTPGQSSLIIPRFDPSKPDSDRFIVKKDRSKKSDSSKKDVESPKKVSKERFYEVSETIKRGLESSGGFSFASLFGARSDGEDQDQGKESEDEVINDTKWSQRNEESSEFSDKEDEDECKDNDKDDEKMEDQGGSNKVQTKVRKAKHDTASCEDSSSVPSSSKECKELINDNKQMEKVKERSKGKLKSTKEEVVITNPLLKYERFFLGSNDDRFEKETFYQPELIQAHLKNWKEKRYQMITALTKKRRHFKHVEKLKSNIETSSSTNKEKKKKYRIFKETVKKH